MVKYLPVQPQLVVQFIEIFQITALYDFEDTLEFGKRQCQQLLVLDVSQLYGILYVVLFNEIVDAHCR